MQALSLLKVASRFTKNWSYIFTFHFNSTNITLPKTLIYNNKHPNPMQIYTSKS